MVSPPSLLNPFEIAASVSSGIAFAVPYLYGARNMSSEAATRHVLGIGLVSAALVHVGFALVWGATATTTTEVSSSLLMILFGDVKQQQQQVLLLELAGVVLYGIWYPISIQADNNTWLALGWVLHPLWGLMLHYWGKHSAAAHIAPEWYVWCCVSFDIIVAGYILVVQIQKEEAEGSAFYKGRELQKQNEEEEAMMMNTEKAPVVH
jgi:hypothetical protein